MRRRDAFLSALVPAYALAHHVPYRHRIGRQEGASVEVGHADAPRSSRRSIAISRHSSAENNRAHRTSDPQGGEVQSASIRPHHTDGRLSELFAFAWCGDRLLSALSGPPVCFTVAAAQYQIAGIGQVSLDWFDVCVATGSCDTWPRDGLF